MKNILVTGGFGFIGGHLIENLLRDPDNHVHVVDDLSTSPIPYERLLEELGHPKNLTYQLASIYPLCAVKSISTWNVDLPYGFIFEEIYHLASPVGPVGVLQHAGKMIKMVVDDIYVLIRLAHRHRAKLIDVSTSEIYGGGEGGLCAEHMDKIIQAETTVRLEYAVAKLAAETAILNTCKVSTQFRASIVRPFNVAGPRQNGAGGFVLPRFIKQAMKHEPLTVFGNGEQRRAFTHVEDIADGLMLVMEKGETGKAYNLGNNLNVVTINDLAMKVNNALGGTCPIAHVDPKNIFGELYAEAAEKFPDPTLAMNELGWLPKWGVDQTIADAIAYERRYVGVD